MISLKKRIYRNFLALILLCITLLSISVSLIFYDVVKNQEMASVRDRAIIVSEILNRGIAGYSIGTNYNTLQIENVMFSDFVGVGHRSTRICLIIPDGTVVFDSWVRDGHSENHGNRQEVIEAFKTGTGESIRFSHTLGSMMYYYAIRLNDGNILRISKEIHNIVEIFISVWFAVMIITVFIIFIAYIVTRKLVDNIISPINNVDLDDENMGTYDEFVPFFKKIKQQKSEITAQLKVLESRANMMKAITDNMREGLIFVDNDGVILSANASVLDIFNETSMINKNILQVCRDTEFLRNINLCLCGRSTEMAFEKKGKMYHIYLSPVHDGDTIGGAIILFLDTTEKYKAEKQRREFSANVSHELKTPLTTISALAEMINNGMVKRSDISGFALKISTQSNRLINIIEDIIRLSEFDEGSIDREFSNFDALDLAYSVVESLQDTADKKEVKIEVVGESLQMTSNERMIDELLFNLVDNGIKYNKTGGTVKVSLSQDNGYYIICVEDTGIGIPVNHQERIFERFYRVDKSRAKKISGTGLGLSIVKHIVECHKGNIQLSSEHGKGTTIKCFIPFQEK